MKNKELKELIENKAKQLKEKLFNVYDVYADDKFSCVRNPLTMSVVRGGITELYL